MSMANLQTQHLNSLLHFPFLSHTNIHALQDVSTLPLQLATARRVRRYGHATANIPTVNGSARHTSSTLTIVILLVGVGLLAWSICSRRCLQQPTLIVT